MEILISIVMIILYVVITEIHIGIWTNNRFGIGIGDSKMHFDTNFSKTFQYTAFWIWLILFINGLIFLVRDDAFGDFSILSWTSISFGLLIGSLIFTWVITYFIMLLKPLFKMLHDLANKE